MIFWYYQKNKVVQDYYIHTTTIHKDIINTDNLFIPLILNDLGIFSLIIYIRDGKINIIYYLIFSSITIITKKSTNYKAIIYLLDKENTIKIKNLQLKTLSWGKIVKFNKILKVTLTNNITFYYLLEYNTTIYHSYAFYTIKILEILCKAPPDL